MTHNLDWNLTNQGFLIVKFPKMRYYLIYMSLLAKIVDKLAEYELGVLFLNYVYSLDKFEVWIIVILIAGFAALLIYRWFGASIFWVLLFVYLISYVVYSANIKNVYEEKNKEFDNRMKSAQEEIDKK